MTYRSNYEIFGEPPVTIMADKPQIDQLVKELPGYTTNNWKHLDKLMFRYNGEPKAILSIPYNDNSWRNGVLEFGGASTVKAVDKEFLTKEEMEKIVDAFLSDVLKPYLQDHDDIRLLRGGVE